MKKTTQLGVFIAFMGLQSAFAMDAALTISSMMDKPVQVVLSADDANYNSYIQYAMQNYWQVNSFTCISEDQFEQEKVNSDQLFLVHSFNQTADESGTVYNEVLKLVCFKKDGKLVSIVAGAPVLTEAQSSDAGLINAVRLVHDKLQFALFKEQRDLKFAAYDMGVDSRTHIVRTKTLYIAREDLDASLTAESIRSVYAGDVVIIGRDSLNAIIDSKSGNALYAVVYNQATSSISYINTKNIVDASSGQLLYSDESTTMKPEGFTPRDFRNMSK